VTLEGGSIIRSKRAHGHAFECKGVIDYPIDSRRAGTHQEDLQALDPPVVATCSGFPAVNSLSANSYAWPSSGPSNPFGIEEGRSLLLRHCNMSSGSYASQIGLLHYRCRCRNWHSYAGWEPGVQRTERMQLTSTQALPDLTSSRIHSTIGASHSVPLGLARSMGLILHR
jgi:hypothetical protein